MNRISACLIVKDEAELLPDCLASLRPFVDEICVVDTGSTDGTPELAAAAGARVEHQPWRGDFSAARNASLAMASHPWIFAVDADERLLPNSGAALRAAVETRDAVAFLVIRNDLRQGGAADRIALARLFRNLPKLRYSRPVHEDISEALFAIGAPPPVMSEVQLEHLGYLPKMQLRSDKLARNLAILRERFKAVPSDLFSAYKLAVSLPEDAVQERALVLQGALTLVAAMRPEQLAELPFLARLFETAARTHAVAGRLPRALQICEQGMQLCPGAALLGQYHADILRRVGDFSAAQRTLASLEGDRLNVVRGESQHTFELRSLLLTLALALDEESRVPLPAFVSDDLAVRCAYLRWGVQLGQLQEVARGLGPLLESSFMRDEVKLVAGELAWASRDFNTARTVWRGTNPTSDAGFTAHGWLALLSTARGEGGSAEVPARDVASAALTNLLDLLNGRASTIDDVFLPAALARSSERWLRELRHVGRADLAATGERALRAQSESQLKPEAR